MFIGPFTFLFLILSWLVPLLIYLSIQTVKLINYCNLISSVLFNILDSKFFFRFIIMNYLPRYLFLIQFRFIFLRKCWRVLKKYYFQLDGCYIVTGIQC